MTIAIAPPKFFNKNIFLLILCQGLYLTNNITFIAINGLVGMSLTPIGWLATFPLMAYVVGAALCTSLVAKVQTRFGRKLSFQFALVVAALSTLLCAYATYSQNFWLLVAGTAIAGYYSANGLLYRFVAPELTHFSFREKAVSFVLAGGVIGAVVGPNMTNWTKDILPTPFLGPYLVLSVAAIIGIFVMQFIDFPKEEVNVESNSSISRSSKEMFFQPIFVVTLICAALGYGVMNLLMAGTPLAMQICGLPFSDTAIVLEWHVIGMFAPGFFTGNLIKKYGSEVMMRIGVILYFASIAILQVGNGFYEFLISMAILGLGWNFLFTAATTLAITTYRPEEKNKAQGIINFFVFGTMAFSSFSSGALITAEGWNTLTLGSIIPTTIIALSLVYFRFYNKNRSPI